MLNWLTKLEGRLHLKSGAVIRFFAGKITTRRGVDNNLSSIQSEGARGWPLYVRLDDISAVTTRRVPLWKGLPR